MRYYDAWLEMFEWGLALRVATVGQPPRPWRPFPQPPREETCWEIMDACMDAVGL